MSDITQFQHINERPRSHDGERRSFHRLVQLTLVFFIAAAAIRRVFGWPMRLLTGAPTPQKSIFAEARASSSAVIPFIFMG
jgi:hypothetical protein